MEFAELIERRRDDVLSCWLKRASVRPCMQGLSQPEIMGAIPKYLSALARSLDAPGDPTVLEFITEHIGVRLRQGFSLEDAASEYALLCRCLVSVWLDHGRPRDDELDWFFDHIEQAQAQARRQFTEHLLDDEQLEKRYLRLLDQLASDALADSDGNLDAHIGELVQLLCKGVDASCGGLFLVEPPERLRLAASCRDCFGLSPPETLALGEVPFLRALAASEEVLSLEPLDGAPGSFARWLRAPEVHSLFGRRLWSRQRLIGVVVLGVHGGARVAARARRRLEVLARRLALLLDNARLYDQLRENMQDLRREREVRERFVAVLAHDLRSPLAAAKANAQLMLLERGTDEERLRIAAKIIRSINRTDRMIQDLLDANRIRAGEKLPLRIEHCNLAAVAAEVMEEMRAVFGDRFELHAEPDVLGWWSPRELKRSLWNLGSNAVKYGREETPIRVQVAHRGAEACFEVQNFGTPLTEEQRANIFDPFVRGRNADTTRGWGLGLTLVRGTAEAHGGRVEVESGEGGNTFRMVLPLDARPYVQSAAPLH